MADIRRSGWRFLLLVRNVDKRSAGISATAAHVLTLLAEHSNPGGLSWPSQERLAVESGLGVRTVCRAIAALQAKGLVHVTARRQHTPNTYRLSEATLASLPAIQPRHAGASEQADAPTATASNATQSVQTRPDGVGSLREQTKEDPAAPAAASSRSLRAAPPASRGAVADLHSRGGDQSREKKEPLLPAPDLSGTVSLGDYEKRKRIPSSLTPLTDVRKTEAELQAEAEHAYATDPALRRFAAKRTGG
jgi:hypothetical protein